jgi:hypothetical protein
MKLRWRLGGAFPEVGLRVILELTDVIDRNDY